MSKPRLSEGRIPFQLGEDTAGPTPPVTDLPYQGSMTVYDGTSGTGPIAGATVVAADTLYDATSGTGSLIGGTVLNPDVIYD